MTTGFRDEESSAASSVALMRVVKAVVIRPGAVSAHRLLVPLVELLHAVFHRALVRTEVVVAALEEGAAAGVHAQGDLVVLGAGFPVCRLLCLDEFALEGVDVLRI